MTRVDTRYILAIDHGTSAVKPAIVSAYGEVIGAEAEPCHVLLKAGGGAEQDPTEWWRALVKATRRLLNRKLVPVDKIVAVSNTSQWSGTVAVGANGKPLMNSVIWMDTRGAPYIDKMFHGIINVSGYGILKVLRWLRKTGGIPSGSGKDPVAHILFIKHEHPRVYKETHQFLEPTDYINLQLTGQSATSFATIQLHWMTNIRDINNVHYDEGLIKRLGIDKAKLPPLRNSTDILGTIRKNVADELGLNRDTKVMVGAGDLHTGIVGSGAVRDYEGHVYIGTSSWVICHVPYKKTDIAHNMASVPSAIPGRYFVANEQESAGACLTFLRDRLLYPDDPTRCGNNKVYQEFDRIAEQVPAGSGKVIFTPWLYGERTPVEDHTVRGAFHNLSLSVSRGELIRAVFEGVAYNSRWVFDAVEKFIKRPMDSLNIIGGGAQSDVWCQIYADVLNRNIRQVYQPIQANARGAAFIAAVGLGYITVNDIPKLIKISKVFKPNPRHRQLYDELYGAFVNVYKANKTMYQRLNRFSPVQ